MFTGCDTVSAFIGKGKQTIWQAWTIYGDATDTFVCLSKTCSVSKLFVVIRSDRTTTVFYLNKARFEMFSRKQRQYDDIPSIKAALHEHTNVTVYQGGHVWPVFELCTRHTKSRRPGVENWNIIGHQT